MDSLSNKSYLFAKETKKNPKQPKTLLEKFTEIRGLVTGV